MSVKRALLRLENTGNKDSAELLPQLARLLGVVDGILWPVRQSRQMSQKNFHGQMNAQQEYFRNGVSFQLDGSDDATWKQSERLRSSLVDAGYAESLPDGKIRLTILGDTVARQLCGSATINNEITRFLFQRLGELPPERGNYWTSEAAIGCVEDDTDFDRLFLINEFMQPLVVHRFVEVASSTISRVYYHRLVDTLPTVEAPLLEHSTECIDQYTKAFCQGMSDRKSLEYTGCQIWIPLSATG